MSTPSLDLFKTESITQNLISLNSAVKKHLHDGVNFMKEEIMDMYDKAGTCLTKMASPVNNFLKDLGQIENELKLEYVKDCICNSPSEEINRMAFGTGSLPGYMEENY